MIPYKIHLDDWTVAMYATDGGLTFTVSNSSEPENYLTRVVGDVRLRRYYIGQQCAGELHPTPFPTYREGTPLSKEAILAREGAG
jgi:hypothetical protein